MFTFPAEGSSLSTPAAFSFGYRIRPALPKDDYNILKIMNRAVADSKDKSLFIPDDLSLIRSILDSEGFGLIALDYQDNPVAYLLVLFPRLSPENLGYDLGFSEKQLLQAAHMDSLAVYPEHRGRRLQKSLITRAEKLLDSTYPYRLATVSPQNSASLKSFLDCGYEIQLTKEKYGGHIRHILMKSAVSKPPE